MKLYADLPARRALQATADAAVLVGVALGVWLAVQVHHAVERLAAPGRRIDESAGDLAGRLRDAGHSVSDLPLVGDRASRPFDGAGAAADQLAAAGHAQVEAVHAMAFWLSFATAAVPVLLVLAFYLPPRIRFVRRATAGRRFLDSAADLDLFALRALANQPLHVLARISDDPARAWRTGDREVVRRLARVELRDAGLTPPEGL